MRCLHQRKRQNLGDAMDNPIVIGIVSIVVLVGIIVLFFVADFLSRRNNTAKKASTGQTVQSPVKPVAHAIDETQDVVAAANIASTLATEIETMIVNDASSRGDKVESASQRSRMHNRRARMLEYYDNKYKSRTVIFDPNSFDDPVAPSQSSLIVDGVEITREDIKKLTALNDLLARKTHDE